MEIFSIFGLISLLFSSQFNQDTTYHQRMDDNYSITDSMIIENYREDLSNQSIFTLDTETFKNDSLNQVIIISLNTDFYRSDIYHFYQNDIPKYLMDYCKEHIQLNRYDIDANKELVEIIKNGMDINSHYFITERGCKVGMTQKEVLNIYGKPLQEKTDDTLKILIWKFYGIEDYIHKKNIPKELVLNYRDFAYTLKIYLKNGLVNFIHINNAIP